MNRQDIAYLINTTPKYFFLLPLHLTLLERYAPELSWPVFVATEAPEKLTLDVNIIPLTQDNEGFLESRLSATKLLPPNIQYVLPMQDDFLLEGRPMANVIQEAAKLLDTTSVSSLRLMPCPGPKGDKSINAWRVLDFDLDSLVFTYQATLWRRSAYEKFLENLLKEIKIAFGPLTPKQKAEVQIKMNVAEIKMGQDCLRHMKGTHLAWPREGKQPNAVYLSAWPYRPTAVVNGKLQEWAMDLADREGVSLS